jgi:transposase-like protein
VNTRQVRDGRRHSAEEISRILEQYRSGSCTQRDLAERHGVCVATIQNWLRRSRHDVIPHPNDWIEVVAERTPMAESYRIELPNGRALVLGAEWRSTRVRELLETLSQP